MTYKALNTFIDDIFAFVIKMPTMYRIGCFRDDIVFFIFLYQRYIYKEDPTRVNEFGYSAEMLDGQNAPNNQLATDGTAENTSATPEKAIEGETVAATAGDDSSSEELTANPKDDDNSKKQQQPKNKKQKSKRAKKID